MNEEKEAAFRIAMLGHKTVPARNRFRGGIEVVVEELAPRMAEMGNDVTCFNRTDSDNERLDEYRGVRLKYVFTIKRKGLAAVTSSFFATIRATFEGYDVIHFHAEGPCFWMWIPKIFKKRCIATIHGLDWKREKWKNGFASWYIKLGERIAVKCASEMIVLSKGTQEYFQKEYARKTLFIPNGVTRPEHREAKEITEKYALEKDSYILFVGRIVPEKGLRYLIEAYKNVKTDKRLIIVGGSSDTEEFMKNLRSIADNRVIFTDFLYGQILEELYSNAYMYVLPSDLEGMPLSLLEAMSYGNCCVVSDIEECTEVVEDKAIVFPKGNVEQLRNKLQELCDHPEEVMRYRTESSDFICNKYSWDEVSKRTVCVYKGNL